MENITSKIYLMADSHGNRTSVVVADSSDSAMVSGLRGRENESLHFESEAYHLPNWCIENGIELRVVTRSEKFADLWDASQVYEPGDAVVYIPNHAKGVEGIEYGIVKRVEGFGRAASVFVVYGRGETAQLTPLSNLFKR